MKSLVQFINESLIKESLYINISDAPTNNAKATNILFERPSYVILNVFKEVSDKFDKVCNTAGTVEITKDNLVKFFDILSNLDHNDINKYDSDYGTDYEESIIKELLKEKNKIIKEFDKINKSDKIYLCVSR